MKYTYLLIFAFFISCNTQPKTHLFTSEFGFTLLLPENWDEYEDDSNLNAFFNTSNWTGNFRVTVIEVDENIDANYINDDFKSHSKAEKLTTQNGLKGFKYSAISKDGSMYYWQLYDRNKILLCSFIMNPKNDIELKKAELKKIAGIVNSIKAL